MARMLQNAYVIDREYGRSFIEKLRGEDVARYLGILMRVARIGEVSVEERNLAVPIAGYLEATQGEQMAALGYADNPDLSLRELVAALGEPVARLCLYRDACRMALADGEVDLEENRFLDELSRALELDGQTRAHIEELVRRLWQVQDEFLALLSDRD